MKLSQHRKLTPVDIPVATIPFRGGALDIYAPSGKDLCWLIAQGASVQEALEGRGVAAIVQAISNSGPHILSKLLSIATGETEEEVEASRLTLAEEVEILTVMFQQGVPDVLRGKILAAAGTWLEAAADRAAAETGSQEESSTPGSTSSSGSEATTTTPTD